MSDNRPIVWTDVTTIPPAIAVCAESSGGRVRPFDEL